MWCGGDSPGNGLLLLPDNAHGKSPINFGDTAPGSKRAGTKVDDSVRKERRKEGKFKFHFHHAEDEFTAEILLFPLSKMNINILHQTQRSGWNELTRCL